MDRRDRKAVSSQRRPDRPGAAARPTNPNRRRRISRAQREAQRQRRLRLGIGIAGAVVILVLAVGVIYDNVVKPNAVLAEVNGARIRRDNYWKYRAVELINQISSYQQLAGSLQGQQQQQYLGLAAQASEELDGLWGSIEVDDATIERMIEDQVYLQNLDDLGIAITDDQIDLWINQQFAPPEAPLIAPTATPTLIPERAAWATETAAALATENAALAGGTPGAEAATPVVAPDDTPGASPVVSLVTPADDLAASPAVSPVTDGGTPVGSPTAESSPVGETSTVAPTPNAEQALSTAEAGFQQYRDVVFDPAHLSRSDYVRLIARPTLARELVADHLQSQVPQTAEQVHAAHILVDTRDRADALRAQLNDPNVDFEQIARETSTDTSTAPNGGDLGWFTRGTMVDQFQEVAFGLQPGQISEPFQTQFGWHIVKIYDHADERALTDAQYEAAKTRVVDEWLAARLAEAEIESDIDPTPTPAPGEAQFEAPPDAPTPPAPTPAPVASPSASPGAEGSPIASPVASGAATPLAPDLVSPPLSDASPVATAAPPVG